MKERPSQEAAGVRWVRPLRKELPTLLIASSTAIGMLAAFVHWTLPAWSLVLETLPRFALLWQMPLARRMLLVLLIQFTSPLLVGFQIGACIWLVFQVAPVWRLLQERLVETVGGSMPLWLSRVLKPVGLLAPEKPAQAAPASSAVLEPPMEEALVSPHAPSSHAPQDRGEERAEAEPSSRQPASQELLSVLASQALFPGEPTTHVPFTAVISLDTSSDAVEPEPALVAATHPHLHSPLPPAPNGETRPYEVVITLLKKVSITVVTAQGIP